VAISVGLVRHTRAHVGGVEHPAARKSIDSVPPALAWMNGRTAGRRGGGTRQGREQQNPMAHNSLGRRRSLACSPFDTPRRRAHGLASILRLGADQLQGCWASAHAPR
jgi:hypothetical protein